MQILNSGSILRCLFLLALVAGLAVSARDDKDDGDYIMCALATSAFGVSFAVELRHHPRLFYLPVVYGFATFTWWTLEPQILNGCHLTVWLLIFECLRNCALVEEHASVSWLHAMFGKVLRAG